VISGKQQALFLEQKADVIRCMTGRVDCAQPNGIEQLYSMAQSSGVCATLATATGPGRAARREIEQRIVAGLDVGLAGHVLLPVGGRRQPHDGRAGDFRERARASGMVAVRVRDKNEPGSRNRRVQQGKVFRVIGPRVEHGNGRLAEHVGVGAGPGHQRSVGCDEPLHSGRDAHQSARR
jgi:hypothetical protein